MEYKYIIRMHDECVNTHATNTMALNKVLFTSDDSSLVENMMNSIAYNINNTIHNLNFQQYLDIMPIYFENHSDNDFTSTEIYYNNKSVRRYRKYYVEARESKELD